MRPSCTSPFSNTDLPPRRPMADTLEARVLLSAAPVLPVTPAHNIDLPAIFQSLDHHHQIKSVLPITINSVSVQNGQLVASGFIGANPFTAPITLAKPDASAAAASANPAATTPILDLQLGPINLNLLGLQVTTSPICLDISAQSGPGNLLGNLLTDIANLLNGGASLGSILGGLTSTQLNSLLSGITGLLNGVLGQLAAPSSISTAASPTAGTTNILHLSVGPLDLNLLGLVVHADNCANGPITLDVNAISGPGNLLGNLLTSLSNSLNSLSNQALAQRILDNTLSDILRLV